MKLFLTGKPGCGKSTVLTKTIELLKEKGLNVGGIITPEVRVGGKRTAFAVRDVYSQKEGTLASVEQKIGPKLGKYRVDIKSFEKVALPALDFALKNCDIIGIDEIGRMEWFSQKFREKIYEILKSDKNVIVCLHRDFINKFKKYGEIIEVTVQNRESLVDLFKKKLSGPGQNRTGTLTL